MVIRGQTTVEAWRSFDRMTWRETMGTGKIPYRGAYDLGWRRNVEGVFGRSRFRILHIVGQFLLPWISPGEGAGELSSGVFWKRSK
mmetsp:Transcript_3394/g.5189  ORF Transcript_3394/g.5189 Transcript_3394/m.5189 type:complete len:86 (+) Transcript_3394:218-475(+)